MNLQSVGLWCSAILISRCAFGTRNEKMGGAATPPYHFKRCSIVLRGTPLGQTRIHAHSSRSFSSLRHLHPQAFEGLSSGILNAVRSVSAVGEQVDCLSFFLLEDGDGFGVERLEPG